MDVTQNASAPETQTQAAPDAVAAPVTQAADPQAKPTEKPLSSGFAALARKEKHIVQREKEMSARLAELEKREEKLKKFESLDNPIEALMVKGWSYEDATNFMLNGQKPTPEQMVKQTESKVDKFIREQQEREQRAAEEAAKKAKADEEEAVSQTKSDIQAFVDQNAEKYELIAQFGQSGLIYDVMLAHFEKTKKVMSYAEGAEAVEKFLESEVEKALSTRKIKGRLAPQPEPTEGQKAAKPQAEASKTLSNQAISTSVPSMLSPKTEQDRLSRALAALGA